MEAYIEQPTMSLVSKEDIPSSASILIVDKDVEVVEELEVMPPPENIVEQFFLLNIPT